MVRRSRPVFALVAGVLALSACSNSAPPPTELGEEMIDSLAVKEDLAPAVVECMQEKLANFELTDAEVELGFTDLDQAFETAADNNAGGRERALEIVQRFEDDLASCTAAG